MDDVLRGEAADWRDRVDDGYRALDRDLVRQADLLRKLAVECATRLSPEFTPPPGSSQYARSAFSCRQSRIRPPQLQDRRHADTRLGRHQAFDDPKPRTPRSVAGSSSTSTGSTSASGTTTSCAIRIPGSTTNGVLRVGVVQDDLDLSAVAGVDQAGRVEDGDPVLRGKSRSRLHEAREAIRNRDGEPRARERPVARPDLHPVAGGQVEAGVALVRLNRHDRVVAQPPDGELGHRRLPCEASSSSRTRNCANRRASAWLSRARTKTPSSRSVRSSTGAPARTAPRACRQRRRG